MQIYGTSQLHGVQSLSGPHTSRPATPAPQSSVSSIGDQLDISAAGELSSRMADIPEIRADRVQQLRAAIESGAYETADKLDVALERLLDEIA